MVIWLIPSKFLLNLKSAPKSSFFRCGAEIRFWTVELQFLVRLRVVLLRFATQCLQIAVEWLRQGSSLLRLHAENFYLLHRLLADAAACGIYTAESRKSYWSGCIKSAMVIWQRQQLFFPFWRCHYKIPLL